MDPRFKGKYIRPEKVGAIQMRAVSEIMDEDQGQSQAGPSEGAADQGAEGGAVSGPPMPLGVKKQRKSLGRFFKKQCQEDDALPLTEKQKVESELERYLMCPDADSESNPGGNIVTCTRAALDPEKVNQLVFLAQNLD